MRWNQRPAAVVVGRTVARRCPMKRSTKFHILVVTGILMSIGIPLGVSEYRWAKANSPRGKFSNVGEYLALGRGPSRAGKAARDGETFLIAYGPMDHGFAMPSGPAAYVFDADGVLVDWSGDIGEDMEFHRRWQPVRSQNVLAQLSNRR